MIERGKPGARAGRVMTAPTRIKLIRDAENPWYEMTLIEGRNREIRKMFEEIGHHVEKIRRVGYGPLVLDVPPGEVRELSADEVEALRRAVRPKRAAAVKSVAAPVSRPKKHADNFRGRPAAKKSVRSSKPAPRKTK